MSGPVPFQSAAIYLIACSVKATIVLATAWGLTKVLGGMSAAFRHAIWAAAILAALALPLLMVLVPAWHSTALGNATATALNTQLAPLTYRGSENLPAMIVNAVLAAPTGKNWTGWILFGWAIGFCVFAVRLDAGFMGLRSIAKKSQPLNQEEWELSVREICERLGIRKCVRLRQCERATAMPVTWGVVRPVILVPAGAENWSETRRKGVLSHELAHIARLDWPLQICAELMRTIYW